MSEYTRGDPPRALVLVALKGFCMGAADVVPGVSGGTMALILGIYQRLLNAIGAFDLRAVGLVTSGRLAAMARHTDLVFLTCLGTGIATALGFFTRVVPLPKLIVSHPEPVYALFFGLIVGSIVLLLRSLARWRPGDGLWLIGGLALGLLIVTLVPTATPEATWFIVLSGALAIIAMVLPGISGSFILLILQKYAYVFDAVGRLDFSVIVPFGLGCALGLMSFSRFLSWLLARFHQATLVTIIGLLIGSLWRIWPFQDRIYTTVRGKQRLMESTPAWPAALDSTTFMAVGLAVAGLVTVWIISHLANRRPGSADA